MSENRQNKLAAMPMKRLVCSMSLPLIFSLLVQSLYNIVDGIFVARLSEQALTATSLAYPVQILMVAVSVGTGVGASALISRKLGAGKREEANRLAATGLLLSVLSGLVFTVLGLCFAPSLSRALASDGETAALLETYLRVCMVFCMGIFVETMAQRLLQAVGNTFLSMVSLVVGALTNIILDPILIFGLLGCPAMGIFGAAVATVIGQWLGALTALVLNYFKNRDVRPSFEGTRPDGAEIRAIYRIGLPTIIMQAMGSVMVSAINAVLLPVSSTAVAFFGVYYKLQNFMFMPLNGLGQAAIPIVAYNYGAKNGGRIREALRLFLLVAVVIAVIGTLIFQLLPGQLLSLFAAGEEMRAIGIPALRIISVTFLMTALTTLIGYCASGLGNAVINMLGTGLRQVVLLIPCAILFLHLGGLGMVWYAMWVAEAAAAVYCIICLRREYIRKVKPLC